MSDLILPGQFGFAMPGEDPRVIVSRPDGRPEAYDVPEGSAMKCVRCFGTVDEDKIYGHGDIVLVSPIDVEDGSTVFCCINHLPDNIVIYDPVSNLCRDKRGENKWREGGDT